MHAANVHQPNGLELGNKHVNAHTPHLMLPHITLLGYFVVVVAFIMRNCLFFVISIGQALLNVSFVWDSAEFLADLHWPPKIYECGFLIEIYVCVQCACTILVRLFTINHSENYYV